jgi:MFS family permease
VTGPDTDWRFTVGIVSGGHFLSHVYLLSLPPLFPLLRSEFGWTPSQLGLLVSAMAAAGLLQPVVGSAVDRFGAKRLLVAGMVVTAVGIALVGLVDSYVAVLGLVAVSGAGQAAFHPANYALIDAVTDERTKGRSFSAHVLAGFLGFAAAPLVVGTVGLEYGWRTALLAVGTVGPVYALATAAALDPAYLRTLADREPTTASGSRLERLRTFLRPVTVLLLAFFVTTTVANIGVQTFTSLLVTDALAFPDATGNAALTAYFAAASAGIVVGGVLADRVPPRPLVGGLLAVAAVVLAAGLTASSLLATATVVGLFAVVGACFGLVLPARDRLVSAVAPSGSAGRTFGFVFAGISLGGVVGPATLGVVIDATGALAAFYVVAGALAAGVGVVALLGVAAGAVSTTGEPTEG